MKALSLLAGVVLLGTSAMAMATTYNVAIKNASADPIQVINARTDRFIPVLRDTVDGTVFTTSGTSAAIAAGTTSTGNFADARTGAQDFYFNIKDASTAKSHFVREFGTGCDVHVQYNNGTVTHTMIENDHGYTCEKYNIQAVAAGKDVMVLVGAK